MIVTVLAERSDYCCATRCSYSSTSRLTQGQDDGVAVSVVSMDVREERKAWEERMRRERQSEDECFDLRGAV